jgi:PTH2 family peptidyl-tRNA hydrolase
VKQAIIVRSDLKMGKGKLAAQAAHASLQGYKLALAKNKRLVEQWEAEGQKKIVLKVASESELLALKERARGLPCALIRDAGFTQIEPGTVTCLVIGPAEDEKVDAVTKNLKLL